MGTLKESIQHEVHLLEHKFMEHVLNVLRRVESKNMTTSMVATNTYRENYVPSYIHIQPTRLTPQQMDEIREKGLCFNCGSK
jgi:hypothetical protein